jgi:Zn-dependent peptidase ImmA (M78 family)/DNA-binding XRE family transcriptional regulator
MIAPSRALITPEVVRWARERARAKRDEVAKALGKTPGSIEAWELGTSAPTFNQAQRLAEILHVPFGYLFLPSPPHERIPLHDFRTLRGAESGPSAELIDLLNDVMFKHQWYRELLLEQGTLPLAFIGKSSLRDGSDQVAESIRDVLHIDSKLRQESATWDEFLRNLIRNAEAAGILVMRSGVAAGDSRRPLGIKEFRGFAISDPIAPLVFLNSKDSRSAQIFTVAHEIVHIWIGETGISNEDLKEPRLRGHADVERFCNQAAAEILAPKLEFLAKWQKHWSIADNADSLAHMFKVSKVVVLRRAFDLEIITSKQYKEHYAIEERKFVDRPKRKGGGNYLRNVLTRNGPILTGAVVRGALEGTVLYRDAARLLNISVPTVPKLADYLAKLKEGA